MVAGRRFPPKQVLAAVTGLDRADFTTHQARRILKRLGFTAARAGTSDPADDGAPGEVSEQAEALRPFIGQWVALSSPSEVLVAAETPQEVLAWLARHEQRAPYGMFRVPTSTAFSRLDLRSRKSSVRSPAREEYSLSACLKGSTSTLMSIALPPPGTA